MLKALGLSKKESGKEGLITQHREQSRLRQQWKQDVDGLRNILLTLRKSYQKSKGGFAVGRYEELKEMIKTAVRQHAEWKAAAGKPGSGGAGGGGAGSGDGGGGSKRLGLISRLRMNAESFASSQEKLEHQEKDYSEMSSKVLQADLEVLRKDILKYKTDLYSLRDKLERLATEYQDSKQHNPTQRYNVLKDLIKTATADVKE